MKLIQKFAVNALVLIVTSVFMRLVSMLFNVWLTNKIGTEGMGLFSLVLSVYSLATTLALSGINLSATRLVSQELAQNSSQGAKKAVTVCTVYSLIFGITSCCLLLFFGRYIASNLLCDIRTLPSLRILAFSLPFISVSSCLCGYFSAVRRVVKNSVTNIIEQFLRIFFTVAVFSVMSSGGVKQAMCAVSCGILFSEILSFATSFILYIFDVKKNLRRRCVPPGCDITSRMVKMSLPIAFSAYIRSALVTVENILIPNRLSAGGLDKSAALSSYGIVTGMVFPLILFPLAFLSAASGLLIPEITRYRSLGQDRQIKYVTTRYFRLSIIFSVAVAGVFMYFSDILSDMIYESAESGGYIKIFAALIPIMYLDNSTDAMLKGLGEQVASMRYNIIDALVSVILVYFLLPPLGVNGYLITVFACELLNASMSIQRLLRVTGIKIKIFYHVVCPVISIVGGVCLYDLIFRILKIEYRFDAVTLAVGITVCFLLYYAFLRATCCITDEDERWFLNIFKKNK